MNYPFSPRPRSNYDKPEKTNEKSLRIALLLHADFININALPALIGKVQPFGSLIIKRFYTTSTDHLATLEQQGFQVCLHAQNFMLAPQIMVEAMDFIHHKQIDALVLCANDPTQSALAHRAKASNVRVFGFAANENVGFGAVCDQLFQSDIQSALPKTFDPTAAPSFTPNRPAPTGFLERHPEWKPAPRLPEMPNFAPSAAEDLPEDELNEEEDNLSIPSKRIIRSLPMRTMVYKAIRDCSEMDGWALTTKIGSYIRYLQPGFDYKLLGYPKLSDFLRAIPGLQLRYESPTRLFCRKIDYAPLLDLLDQAMREYQDADGWADIDDVEDFVADDWSYQDYGFESFRSLLDTVVGAEVDDVNHLMRYTRTTRYTSS